MSERLVCIRRKSDGMPSRLPQRVAETIINDRPGEFEFTSKSYAKSYYKRMNRTMQNHEALKAAGVDFSTNQKKNFVEQEGNKIIAWRFRGNKTITYEMPEDEQKAAEKKTWLEKLIDSACRNPNDQSIKAGILSKLAIFFGFLQDSKKKQKGPTQESVDLPQYQRYNFGYGDINNLDKARLA
jgi:hypothetical protein